MPRLFAPFAALGLLALSLFAPAPAQAQAPDFTSRIELLGNPLTARWGAANTGAKVINTLEPYQGRLLIGSGDTATNTSIDVWSWNFHRQTFDFEQRIRQELVVRFREFNNKIYINNEDLSTIGANINILDGTTWTRRDIRLPNNQPFDSFAVEHSRDVYLWDGKIFSSNGNRSGFPHLLVSEDDGVSWRVARGGPIRGADSSQEPLHFFVVQDQLYVMPWSNSTPIFRYTPGSGDEFTVAHASYSAAGFPHIANQLYQRRSVSRNGVAYYHTFNRLYAVHQMEPTLDLREFNNFPGLTVNETTVRVQDFHFTTDGRFRVLLSQTITSGANQYFNRARVFESTNDGQSWTELFNALCPGPRLLFARFASQDDEFFLTTNFDYHYADGSGVPARLGGTDGNVYRISLAATGRPRATALSDRRVRIDWRNQSTGVSTWELQRLASDGITWTPLTSVPAGTLTFTDTGLQNATTYTYRVRANHTNGTHSAWSGVAVVDTLQSAALQPPVPLSAFRMSVSWVNNSDGNATGWELQRLGTDGVTWTTIANTAAGVLAHTDSGLAESTAYSYRVRALFSGASPSAWSTPIVGTTLPALDLQPLTPVSAVRIDLSWTDQTDASASSWEIQRLAADGTTWLSVATTAGNVLTHSNAGLTEATSYTYRVRAHFPGGASSAWSASRTASTPAAVILRNAQSVSPHTITINWIDNTEGSATGWELQHQPAGSSTWQTLVSLPLSATFAEHRELSPDSTHAYRIRATYPGDPASPWSTPVSVTTSRRLVHFPDADAGIEGTTLRGANATMNVKQHGNRKAYLRFDLRDIPEDLRHAELRVTFTTLFFASSDLANGMNFRLYGLNPGSTAGGGRLGEDWPEWQIHWNNAPANNTSSGTDLITGTGTSNGGQAQLLLTLNVPGTTVNGDTITFSGPALVNFLNSVRATGRPTATLALTRANGSSDSNSVFATKENTNLAARPRLIAVPLSAEAPTTPVTGLAATTTASSASLSWEPSDVDGLTGYGLQRRLLPDGAWTDVANVSTTHYIDSPLAADTPYAYRIRPLSLLGLGPWSPSALAVTQPPPPFGLVAHWPFTETGGAIAADASGQGRDLTFTTEPTWPDDATRGRVVNLSDSPANQLASVPDEAAFNSMSALTIAFWVRPSGLNGDPRFIISKRTGPTDGVFSVFFHTNNRLWVDLDGNNNRFSSNTVFANNTWYHIALVFDGSLPLSERVSLYVNGALDRRVAETSAVLNSNSAPVWIGQPNTGATARFFGRLSDLRIHRHAFAASQIPTLMAGGLPPIPPSSAAYGTLDRWRQRHFSAAQLADPLVSGPTASPAGDGVPNLLKYALGLDPLVPASPAALPRLELSPAGDVLTLVYQRPRYTPDVSTRPEWSATLGAGDWHTHDIVQEITLLDDLHEEVEAHLAREGRPRLFLRLRAE